jgi:hypothetical protein
MNKVGFLGFAVAQAETARTAMLRFHVAAALAYHAANVTEGNGSGDEVKAALKLALRNGGTDRKTADRWVNDACKLAIPLVERFPVDFMGTVSAVVDDVIAQLRSFDCRNVAEVKTFLGLDKKKEKDVPGATLAEMISAMAGGAVGDEDAGGAPEAPEAPEAPAPAPFDAASLLRGLTLDQVRAVMEAAESVLASAALMVGNE